MKALSSITALLVLFWHAPQVAAQGYFQPAPNSGAAGPYGYQRPMLAPSFSTPMTTAFFQDSSVPAPADVGNAPVVVPNSSMGGMSMDNGAFLPMDSYPQGGQIISSPDLSMPMYQDTTTWNAFSPPQVNDPFLDPNAGQPGPYAPYSPYQSYGPGAGSFNYGANPAQPYRFGWQNRIDVSWLPGGNATGAGINGDHDIFGVDYELAYGTPFLAGWVLNWTNQFAYRNWGSPTGVDLPSDLFRFGADFELETTTGGPISLSLGITPSINTDFNASTSEGFQLDGRGILLMQLDQYWTLGLGAMYWDRVNDRVLPYGGLIYRDDFWEWQIMYPESRVSLFLGNEAYWSKWAYIRAEYHVEAFGYERIGGIDDQVEISDYRFLLGLKMDAGLYNWFIEGGWVTNREVEFKSGSPGYDLDSGFIGQIGLRY